MKISEEANEVNRICKELAGETYCDNNRLDEFEKDDSRGSKTSDADKPKKHSVYKYSKEIPLAEQIILGHESVFLQIIDDKPIISRLLDLSKEQNIILKPYPHGISGVASPIIPIKFGDIDELEYFIKQARKETIESIYLKHKSLWKNFVVAKDQNTIIFLAVDSVYSHFQDLFETTHYDLIYGPPGSGKGAMLITFSLLGYRVVLAADLNGANLLDLYGSAEICQITIAEDELDDIHRDPDKHKIYKIGYDFTGTTQRTLDGNTSNRNNRLYSVYGFKLGAAENQIESRILAGFNDRGFQFHSIKGNPRYSIKKALKEMMKPVEKQLPKYRIVISQLEYIRKLTLIFRMIHHDDTKGGRGSLLEKIIAFIGNPYSTYGVTLSKIISIIVTRSNKNRNPNQNSVKWLNKSNIRKLKFDLVNINDDRLIILELKNRVDSGGTAAREEALSKKFFALSRLIESEEKIFHYLGKDYNFLRILSMMGINKVEMMLGLLFDINGQKATIRSDRLNGFYSSSKSHMKHYMNEPHPSLMNLMFDESKLSLSFKKRSLEVSINMLYGNEVIQRFSSKPYGVNEIMKRVFPAVWDDIWLVLNIAIQQRAMLLSQGNNHISHLIQIKEKDERFNEAFTKFCHNSLNQNILLDLVNYVFKNKKISTISLFLHDSNQDDSDYLADCLYAFASYIVSKTNIVKSRKRMVDTLDLNKDVLLEK